MLTGERPTGPLHLGHLFGTVANRVRLQQSGVETFLVLADYQVITDREAPGDIAGNVREIVLDYLAAGIDPDARDDLHAQRGARPAPADAPVPLAGQRGGAGAEPDREAGARRLRQVAVRAAAHLPGAPGGGHPVLPRDVVPVGRDQLPHLELTRTIARRFTARYGPCFTEPEALLSEAPTVLGTDGRKMSKSRGNAIELRATADETVRAIRSAKTDTDRHITYDPSSRPEVANLLLLASLCTGVPPEAIADEVGSRGAGHLKALVADALVDHLAPLRARRALFAAEPGLVADILAQGNAHANELADATIRDVRELMGMVYA